MHASDTLQQFVQAWRFEVDALNLRTLRKLQEPPYVSMPFGTLGLAYTYWRLGDQVQAQRWLRATTQRDAFLPNTTTSALYGSFAAQWLKHRMQLIGAKAVSASIQKARCRSDEFLFGRAGFLNAATQLAEPHDAADVLAERMLRKHEWTHLASVGFAHGRAGICYALLKWSARTRAELPTWFWRTLQAIDEPNVEAPLLYTWCNGWAGLTLLWTQAYRATQDKRYLAKAKRAGRLLMKHLPRANGDLCCGLAGRAYALLALHGVDGDSAWHERALTLAERATTQMRSRWPSGLFKGYPGIACLASELISGSRGGFPWVEY